MSGSAQVGGVLLELCLLRPWLERPVRQPRRELVNLLELERESRRVEERAEVEAW